jgi:hypothetical protein
LTSHATRISNKKSPPSCLSSSTHLNTVHLDPPVKYITLTVSMNTHRHLH